MVSNEAQANGSDAGPQAKEYLRCDPGRAVAVDDLKLCGRVGATYTCETGMKAAMMKSPEPTRRENRSNAFSAHTSPSSPFLPPVSGGWSPITPVPCHQE